MKTYYLNKLFFIVLCLCSMHAHSADIRLYTFGHSLINHALPITPIPSDETTIAHWIHDISQAAGHGFAAGGQYGFLTSHDDLPPNANWGYDNVPAVWEGDTQSFSEANINTILLTAANFIQGQPANQPHPVDLSTTAVQSTQAIFDWVHENSLQQSNVTFYIYENWPEMDLQSAFPPTPPTQVEIDNFHQLTLNNFNDWWIDYDALIRASRPQYAIELIPVGPIISKLLTDIIPNQIPFPELYEDSAPHGRATLYFLAAMITYMAIYNENIPSNYMPDTIVHPVIRNNLAQIRNFIWSQLEQEIIFENGFE